jgi:hypothetical protein
MALSFSTILALAVMSQHITLNHGWIAGHNIIQKLLKVGLSELDM